MPTGTKPRPAFPLGSTFTTQSAFIGRCETGRQWRSSTTAPPHWLALAVDMWTTQERCPQRCPQTHSSRRSLWLHDKKEKERTRFPTRNHLPLVLMTGSTSHMPVAFTMPRSPPVSPTPAIHPMPGEISIEVLTKCRVQYLLHGDVRFVDTRRY